MGIPPIKFELKILKYLIVNPESYVSAIAVFQSQLIAGRAHLMHSSSSQNDTYKDIKTAFFMKL